MPVLQFPNPEEANADGIVAVGGDLHPHSLLSAYQSGIFPWPIEGLGLAWFSPDPRAILDFSALHLPASLRKFRRKMTLHCTVDRAFAQVIAACSLQTRPGQKGTWITPELIEAYIQMHQLGYAHSAEVWHGAELVGGIYGVAIRGVFSAESMFYQVPNASKIALIHLVEHVRSRGATWIDIQMMTPHMERLGAEEIPRERFLKQLIQTQKQNLVLF